MAAVTGHSFLSNDHYSHKLVILTPSARHETSTGRGGERCVHEGLCRTFSQQTRHTYMLRTHYAWHHWRLLGCTVLRIETVTGRLRVRSKITHSYFPADFSRRANSTQLPIITAVRRFTMSVGYGCTFSLFTPCAGQRLAVQTFHDRWILLADLLHS